MLPLPGLSPAGVHTPLGHGGTLGQCHLHHAHVLSQPLAYPPRGSPSTVGACQGPGHRERHRLVPGGERPVLRGPSSQGPWSVTSSAWPSLPRRSSACPWDRVVCRKGCAAQQRGPAVALGSWHFRSVRRLGWSKQRPQLRRGGARPAESAESDFPAVQDFGCSPRAAHGHQGTLDKCHHVCMSENSL